MPSDGKHVRSPAVSTASRSSNTHHSRRSARRPPRRARMRTIVIMCVLALVVCRASGFEEDKDERTRHRMGREPSLHATTHVLARRAAGVQAGSDARARSPRRGGPTNFLIFDIVCAARTEHFFLILQQACGDLSLIKVSIRLPVPPTQEKVRSHARERGARGWRAVHVRAGGHCRASRRCAPSGGRIRGEWAGGLQQDLVPFAWGG
jgi:hypothetical protein